MVGQGAGVTLIAFWAVTMIGLAYYIYRRQSVTDTKEFITAGGRAGRAHDREFRGDVDVGR